MTAAIEADHRGLLRRGITSNHLTTAQPADVRVERLAARWAEAILFRDQRIVPVLDLAHEDAAVRLAR